MFCFLYNLISIDFTNKKIDLYYKRVIFRLLTYSFSIYYWLLRFNKIKKLKDINRDEKLIVTLTSFPPRIKTLWLTIESILHQTVQPDSIILTLYKGEFRDDSNLPSSLKNLKKRGLIINFTDENLKPHKKYFYTLKAHPDANIITIDDDVIYPQNLIEKILAVHNQFKNEVCCTLAREIKVENDHLGTYENWRYIRTNSGPRYDLLPIGAGGVLYPVGSIHQEVFNKKVLKEKSLNTDDLWLKVMSIKNNRKVVCLGGEFSKKFVPIYNRKDKRLFSDNIGGGENDFVFQKLLKRYHIPLSIFNEKQAS